MATPACATASDSAATGATSTIFLPQSQGEKPTKTGSPLISPPQRPDRETSSLDRPVGDLSYGERRLRAIARAVAASPSILLLDEPAAGLSDDETREPAHLAPEALS
ncbi:ATP-binding cassette domain-containing protein [Streptomyces sp. NL15-2K]|uniref:ATP-binding cassette domain-containing protein n=1 Tax=Streptomyces sp. NL15-2K TaxID=376149 RepID=UPI000FFA9203|nr:MULTISPECIES: ATP-binding cassette domain-containing protein [Actinomycetes]WKX14742.1 ATP-binding cassette domain-containing protein [Kutzneria buriramensis]GCB52462.1 branched-chain amino acid transport ATP-binding protein livG [Streptomyces sp. NL15-2K]